MIHKSSCLSDRKKIDVSCPIRQFAIEGNKVHINDWKKGGGGVLAYISLKLAPERLSLTWTFCTIEVLAIDITYSW